jgi:hypothetical protein
VLSIHTCKLPLIKLISYITDIQLYCLNHRYLCCLIYGMYSILYYTSYNYVIKNQHICSVQQNVMHLKFIKYKTGSDIHIVTITISVINNFPLLFTSVTQRHQWGAAQYWRKTWFHVTEFSNECDFYILQSYKHFKTVQLHVTIKLFVLHWQSLKCEWICIQCNVH